MKTVKLVKTIIEVVKIIGLIAHAVEIFECIESFVKKRTQKNPNPVGFNTEEK